MGILGNLNIKMRGSFELRFAFLKGIKKFLETYGKYCEYSFVAENQFGYEAVVRCFLH